MLLLLGCFFIATERKLDMEGELTPKSHSLASMRACGRCSCTHITPILYFIYVVNYESLFMW